MPKVSTKTLVLAAPLLLLAACKQEEVSVEPALQEGDGAGELIAEPAEGVEVNLPETPMHEVVVDPSATPSATESPAAQ